MPDKLDDSQRIFSQDWKAGHVYDLESIRADLVPVIDEMHRNGTLGKVVADIGSGRYGVSSEIKYPEVKIIRVDLVAPLEETEKIRQFPADLRKIKQLPFETKKQIVTTKNWLLRAGIGDDNHESRVDTIVLSSVINYLAYKEVIPELLAYLKPGGRIIIYNKPERGSATHAAVFSEDRPRGNYGLIHFLETDLGLEIEQCKFDNMDVKDLETARKAGYLDVLHTIDQGYVLLVVKKKAENA